MRRFFRPALIVGPLPNTLANGQTADAVPLMADLNWIVNQVNAAAAPLANTALLNVTNSFTQPQGGVSAQTVSQFVIAGDIITGGYQTLTSALGTNTITARSTQIVPSSLVANQAVFLIPSQTNTGPVSLNRDSLGSFAVLQMGSGLSGGELRAGIPYRLFFDGTNYQIIGPFLGGKVPGSSTFLNGVSAITAGATPDGTVGGVMMRQSGAGPVVDWVNASQATDNRVWDTLVTGLTWKLRAVNDAGNVAADAIVITRTGTSVPSVALLGSFAVGGIDLTPTTSTWTPSVGGTATYTTQTGNYTKVGRLVFFDGVITINAIGSGSTSVISGLPFAATSSFTVVNARALNSVSGIVSISGSLQSGQTTVSLLSRSAAAGSDSATAIFQGGTTVHVSGCYMA